MKMPCLHEHLRSIATIRWIREMNLSDWC